MTRVRTTIRIDRELYRRAKELSVRTGRTVSDVIEDSVRRQIDLADRPVVPLPDLPVAGGSGVLPGVDLGDVSALLDEMDEDHLDALR